ncbi:probable carboxypeptidase G2 precursor [hydrothermal vent metagenome]|uniref:Probable carboxypeptidase G2 n=1 Tax=hydrothermal vent metagenome TaxID=652676 RepID=A0A3B0RTT8_9ZZZZ
MKVAITTTEQAVLNQIDLSVPQMIATLKQWSNINSGSMNIGGLDRQRAEIMTAFAELGGQIDEVALPATQAVNAAGETYKIEHAASVRLVQRPDAPTQILLTGHYDTVFPENSTFQQVSDMGDGRINGPGVADMKGGLLVMRQALLALETSPLRKNIGYTVLINPDEEIGSTGSASLLKHHAQNADLGMTYEPALADGSLSGARKGSGNFSIVIRGRSAHAGREHHLGRNAIVAGAELIVNLSGLTGARDGLTVNVAKLEGGGANNVVPDLAVVRFNVRLAEPDDMLWFEGQICGMVQDMDAIEGFSAKLHGGFTRPPKPMAPPNAALFAMTRAAGDALGLDIRWKATGGVCEGNNLWAAGCPNVDTLGVCGGEIHSDREFMVLSSLAERARLSALMLFKFASGDFDAKSLRMMKEG